jgi:hypothetical protein
MDNAPAHPSNMMEELTDSVQFHQGLLLGTECDASPPAYGPAGDRKFKNTLH